ncbi:hypothetical protein L1987_49731 [Smallanthus sonchifolius]|uniref:Uncharacterized protein n=1 Tax=Smallanthus sonchifolius TaxID=185202 RepID=A0ACB9FVJ8_9ASTR|nr:hypothetical protein L1987_49731 [Smallanthus sonchifolius]
MGVVGVRTYGSRLISGGGYAEKVAVPSGQVFPIAFGVSLKDAASFPEVACTVWSTVFMTSKLSSGETFLSDLVKFSDSSGIGTFAIQIAKYLGVKVFVTAGSEEKLKTCKELMLGRKTHNENKIRVGWRPYIILMGKKALCRNKDGKTRLSSRKYLLMGKKALLIINGEESFVDY